MPELLVSDSALDALRLSLETAAISTALCIVLGGPLAVGAGPRQPARPARAALGGAAAAGAAAGRRRARAAVPAGPQRAARPGARPVVRDHDPVHHGRGRARADVRRAAVPRRQPGGGAAHGRASATRPSPRRSAPRRHWRSGGSPCRWCCRAWRRARCSRSRAASASSARPPRSRAACRAPRAPCRCWCTWSARPTWTRPWRCRWCWSSVAVVVIAVARAARASRRALSVDRGSTRDVVVGRPDVHARRRDHRRTRRGDRRARAQRGGQVHAARRARRAAAPVRRARAAGSELTDVTAHVPPHRRGVGLLAQQALLFPHLTALANVAFGPRAHGVPRRAAEARARELLDRRRRRGARRAGGPRRCRAASSSGWRWPARSPPTPTCCCSTSRSPRSTSTPRPRCARCCAGSCATASRPPCSSPTPRSTRWCSPTGWWC